MASLVTTQVNKVCWWWSTCKCRNQFGSDYFFRGVHQGFCDWKSPPGKLEQLTTIARSQPHAACEAFTHGMTSKWTYFTCTMPGIGPWNTLQLHDGVCAFALKYNMGFQLCTISSCSENDCVEFELIEF